MQHASGFGSRMDKCGRLYHQVDQQVMSTSDMCMSARTDENDSDRVYNGQGVTRVPNKCIPQEDQ